MRHLLLLACLVMTVSGQDLTPSGRSFEEILTQRELQTYGNQTSYKDRLDTLNRVLERLGRQLTSHIRQLELAAGRVILVDISTVAREGIEEAENASNPKDFRSRPVKKLEIRLRKLAQTLEELKLAVPFESRAWFEETARDLEMLREKLLSQLFGNTGGAAQVEPSIENPGAGEGSFAFGQSFAATSAVSLQRRTKGVQGDQFTDEELDDVREAQELWPRVKEFLKISESRLTEIERRLNQEEWTREEPNPLEYYTLAQMVHAYQRAIEGIMVNIDDRAKHGTAEKKHINKSLKELNKAVIEFLPRLEPLQQHAMDTRDEELYREVKKAIQSTETARKGSQMALGAPAKN